jgi:glycosyltransferase involved in cell wall biosynthesis
MKKIGVLTTHPIQYQAPMHKKLDDMYDLDVYFSHNESKQEKKKSAFGVEFEWPKEILEGYSYSYLKNIAKNKSVSTFFGCNTPEIIKKIKENKYDAFIVHGWYTLSYWQAILACNYYHIPIMVRTDSTLNEFRPYFVKLLKKIFYRLLINRFDAFLSVGIKNKEYLIYYGADTERIFFSPHFVDATYFTPENIDNISRKKVIRLLFVGSLINIKRPLDIIYAASKLKNQDINLEINYVGSGNLTDKIVQEAKACQVQVNMIGFLNQNELIKEYMSNDIFILPSQEESWGLVVNEAMMVGIPVIATTGVGCAADLIVEGVTGELYNSGDIDQLARKISKISNNSNDYKQEDILKHIKTYSVDNCIVGVSEAVNVLSNNFK